MKKFMSVVLALVLCLSLTVPAMATTADELSTMLDVSETSTGSYTDDKGRTVYTYPAGTVFALDGSNYQYIEYLVEQDGSTVCYGYPGMTFTLPDDGKVYTIRVMDGFSFSYTTDCYVSSGSGASSAEEYGPYTLAYPYGMTYFMAARAEKSLPISVEGKDHIADLIPLNVKSGSEFGFGGMDGFAYMVPFYKAVYNAETGTITNLTSLSVPVDPDYGSASIDDLMAVAANVSGNVIVFVGPADESDELNAGISDAIFMLKLDGADPEPPAEPVTPAEPEKPEVEIPDSFSDVKESDWFHDSVFAAAKTGIISGEEDGSFDPSAKLTWTQAILFAVRLAQYNAGEQIYGDNDSDIDYMNYALDHGYIDAIPADPEAIISRGDALIIFAAALGETGQVNEVSDGYFTDLAADHSAYAAAYKLARAGMVVGTGNHKFSAEIDLTRSQAAALIARMAGQVEPVAIP